MPWAVAENPKRPKAVLVNDHAGMGLSPYVWKCSGRGAGARAEAAMPGAYAKTAFTHSTTISLIVDGTANHNCPASSMPVIEYSIDEGQFKIVALTIKDQIYTLPLAAGLDAAVPHRIELYFRAADLTQNRWTSSTAHWRIVGFALDAGGSLLPYSPRPRRAIGFGDSITEGVGVDGLFTSWQSLGVNNARATWLPIACAALNCEYGQLGTGGQGMTRPINMPPLPQTWDHYDPTSSRLTGGLLLPEPDYVFCAMGTNDFDKDISTDYINWLAAVRKACPNARLFCIVPTLGVHKTEVSLAVETRYKAGDHKVYLIETEPLKAQFRAGKGATQLAFDGVHPSEYGNAMLGALIAVQVQKILQEPVPPHGKGR